MSDPFVPYVTEPVRQRATQAPFRVMVVSQPDTPQSSSFVPLPSPPSPGSASPASRPVTHAPHPGGPEPQITLDRDGDRITRISIRCSCGQVIQLDCSY